jgi:hypothetical protein
VRLLWSAALLSACSVDAVNLEGRACPCVSGYVCDSTNHCVASADASVDAPSSEAGDAGNLIFDEEFDGGTLDTTNKWVVTGDGVWSIQNGYGEQTNGSTSATLMYAKNFVSATDYHIVTRMHSTGPFAGQDIAPEIAFRVDPSGTKYNIPFNGRCNVDVQAYLLYLQITTSSTDTTIDSTPIPVPSNFDQGTWFVIDAVIKGNTIKCTVTIDNLTPVSVSGTSFPIAAGSFGLKTYDTMAEFAYFRVYGP